MSFIVAAIASVQDQAKFMDSATGYTKSMFNELDGSMEMQVHQFVMAGEMAGLYGVSFEWESVDAALEGADTISSDPGVQERMMGSGASVVRRSIMENIAEDGQREGKYLSATYLSGTITDEGQAISWKHAQSGANGFMTCRSVASGMAAWTGVAFAWTDSVDAMNASRASMLADPEMMQIMSKNDMRPVGRTIMAKRG
jgi:hypothetical protein